MYTTLRDLTYMGEVNSGKRRKLETPLEISLCAILGTRALSRQFHPLTKPHSTAETPRRGRLRRHAEARGRPHTSDPAERLERRRDLERASSF